MSDAYLLVALGYVLFGLGLWWFEAQRIRRTGVDAITVFLIITMLQTCVAGIGIYSILPLVDPTEPTGNSFFDRVFQTASLTPAFLVLALTVWFIIFLYVGCAIGRLALRHGPFGLSHPGLLTVSLREGRLFLVLSVGAALTLWSFMLLGDGMLTRYANLILYRSQAETIERTALNANAFALTQTWSWLSAVAAICAFGEKRRPWLKLVYFTLAVGFALFGASRRSMFLPLLLVYLVVALHSNRWRLGWVMAGIVPILVWLAFGKELLAALAFDVPLERVAGGYASWASGALRAASEVGISIVESVGTVTLVHVDMRLGVDHLLSLAQRFPEGILGIDIDWPQRIVRTTTETFADSYALDIPPGLLGQMWLDAGVMGPVFWGVALGLQVALVQVLYESTERTLRAAAVVVVLVFVIALPVNTGSYDFTFSIDIIVLLAALWWCFRFRRVAPADASLAPADGSSGYA